MRKIFVLDTNVIIHNADAINVFADNEVVLPIDVIEELDIFKGLPNISFVTLDVNDCVVPPASAPLTEAS